MIRQIHHKHNQHATVHPEPDGGKDQNFINEFGESADAANNG